MSNENNGQVAEASSNDESSQASEEAELESGAESALPAEAQDAAATLQDPNASKKEVAEAKKTLKQLKIKYNGKEFLENLPFEIPDDAASRDYMSKHLQMSKMAQTKSQEKSDIETQVQDLIEQLRKNPKKVLSDPFLNVDIKKMAAEILEEEIANSQKSPEQLKAEKLEQEIKDLKEARKKEDEEFKKREIERLTQQELERYDFLVGQAIEESDLPRSPYVVKKMGGYMLEGLQAGYDITPKDVIGLVRQEIVDDLQQMFQVMPEDVIENLVGKENINKIRKKNLAKAKAAAKPATPLQSSFKDTGQKTQEVQAPTVKKTIKQVWGI